MPFKNDKISENMENDLFKKNAFGLNCINIAVIKTFYGKHFSSCVNFIHIFPSLSPPAKF